MTSQPSKDSDRKEMWGCIGAVTVALITGLVTLIAADKIPFIFPSPTATSIPAQIVATTLVPTVTIQISPSQYSSPALSPIPQKVQWIPDNDGMGTPGLCTYEWNQSADDSICPNNEHFVSWNILSSELEQQVLPLISSVPSGSRLKLRNGPNGELNWVIEVNDSNGNEIANVWIGNDPLNSWKYDGLIRIGYPYNPVSVWATFVRYSDNSYRRQ
jgi:hypothetical protein